MNTEHYIQNSDFLSFANSNYIKQTVSFSAHSVSTGSSTTTTVDTKTISFPISAGSIVLFAMKIAGSNYLLGYSHNYYPDNNQDHQITFVATHDGENIVIKENAMSRTAWTTPTITIEISARSFVPPNVM